MDVQPGWVLRNMHLTISAPLHLTINTTLKLADAVAKYFMARRLDHQRVSTTWCTDTWLCNLLAMKYSRMATASYL